ncbi:sulfate/molybdate ABC transporter ATP-binding protein [Brevibacillus choshinensis]|uniref:Sulfate ABC transporter ATP-binding protein n=1 Tax=Brevibacillus choshinensis TaxID=54911 RepID=A0ABX7FUQ6_BRECH|nr:sulfate ABC transporter ATP-binding protein [Brevibacillus choshinensis]QRG69993.1 sulfate ABC transporter ATP-binding protein [Brevibacillus choshinensis]
MSIEVVNITKSYKNFTALSDVSLQIPEGELVALLGPSGSGKTTLLRLIAGLEQPEQGSILFNGEDNTDRDVRERRVGFVFQHYALFRHMNIFDNIAFGLTVRSRKTRPSKQEIHERVHSLLKLVQLEGLAHRYPSQLSGGQRQRVALARALAVEPKFLLLDEPFGALDTKVRQELRRWLRHLHGKLGLTILFVTHDQEEAMELADQVVVMNEGKVEQVGSPEEIYNRPANPFVYSFLGRVNLFHGRLRDGKVQLGETEYETQWGQKTGEYPTIGYMRPHDVEISLVPHVGQSVKAQIRRISLLGPIVRLDLKRLDTEEMFEAELTRQRFLELQLEENKVVYATLHNVSFYVDSQQAIAPSPTLVPLRISI